MQIGLQVPSFTWPGGPAELGTTFKRIVKDTDPMWAASRLAGVTPAGR